jgi:hypothetical protein
MEAAPASDAGPRAFGIAVSLLCLAAGWALAMPISDALDAGGGDFLGLVCFAALLGGSLALAGFAARIPAAVWSGASVAMFLFFFSRHVWPYLPVPILLVSCAAWWQARQPRGPASWQILPAEPLPPQAAPRRMP